MKLGKFGPSVSFSDRYDSFEHRIHHRSHRRGCSHEGRNFGIALRLTPDSLRFIGRSVHRPSPPPLVGFA